MTTTKSGIYKIINKLNGKIYIGSAFNLSNRFSCHKYTLSKNKHKNPHLQNAWNVYGDTVFEFEVLELVERSYVLAREQYWLDFYKAYDKTIGYNIAKVAGNTSGNLASPETRAKQSESAKRKFEKIRSKNNGKIPWDFKILSDKDVERIRDLYVSGVATKEIHKEYSVVSLRYINSLINNKDRIDPEYVYVKQRRKKKVSEK